MVYYIMSFMLHIFSEHAAELISVYNSIDPGIFFKKLFFKNVFDS